MRIALLVAGIMGLFSLGCILQSQEPIQASTPSLPTVEKATPTPDEGGETLTIFGETQTVGEIMATERARIERNGVLLVCGPGLEALKAMTANPPTVDEARFLFLIEGLCQEAGYEP